MSVLSRSPHCSDRAEGFITLGAGILTGLALLASFLAFRFGMPFVDGATRAELKTCITDVKAALDNLREEQSTNVDGGTKELGWDDQRVQIIERCRALLARVANDLRANGTTGFTNKGRELTNLIPETIDGFTVSNTCSLEDPPVGTAGLPYTATIRAHLPFGGSSVTTGLNMTGAVSATADLRQGGEPFSWFGRFNLTGNDTRNASGLSSSINALGSADVLDRNGNPFVPISGIPCPGGSTIQPGSGACKIACSASKSFTWKTPPIPDIRAFVVAPTTIDLANPPPFITLAWNVHDAVSVSIDQDIGPQAVNNGRSSGFWLEFPPIQDTTYTLTATGVLQNMSVSRTVKVVKTAKCSEVQNAGGDAPDTRLIDLGKPGGTFQFDYETFVQEDQIIVSYEGKPIFNSGCVGTDGMKTVGLSYAGTSTQISVQVNPNCKGGTGTAWQYTVHCPL
ncbi:MAG: hypothetical protein HYY11_07110 [Candidatus Methylomirabilis oxyfera]|nr:hypothetical protein [Candidatus Methylomirabilis oxyfera]